MKQARYSHHVLCLLAICVALFFAHPAFGQDSYNIEAPELVLTNVSFTVEIEAGEGLFVDSTLSDYTIKVGDASFTPLLNTDSGKLTAEATTTDSGTQSIALVHNGQVVAEQSSRSVPGWLSIVPPLLAILIALLFKRVIPALFLGIWVGAWVAVDLSLFGLGKGLLDGFQVYVRNALADGDHVSIVLFTLMIGGMVGIISKNGGTQGIVNNIVRWANTSQRGQIATWALGLVIFFDDYANTLVVGKTMRPVTDKLRISREKLAYIVDSTAAPVASLALVTTWIGYEVGLIGAAADRIDGLTESAYSIFLNSLGYSFYPLLALFFVLMVGVTRRDWGPMYKAELRARTTGQVAPKAVDAEESDDEEKAITPIPGRPQRAVNAIIPVIVLIVGVLWGLYATGDGDNLRDIIGSADSYTALMWASLCGVIAAALLSVGQRILTLEQTVEAWYAGLRSMMFAMIILVLAWALSSVTEVIHTADFLVSVLGETIPPPIIPMLVFFLAAATGFATGSSWGAMGILMPLVIPLTWAILETNGVADAGHFHIIYSTVACVLGGSVWGDHCSPISDTTILSSMASSCDHIEHVRTQLPYALLVGFVAIGIGTLPTGYGFPWWISVILGMTLLFGFLRFFGKRVEDAAPDLD